MRLTILLSCITVVSGETVTPVTQIFHAEKLHASGDLSTAAQILLDVVQDNRTPKEWLPRVYTDLGTICHDQGRTVEAERWHLKARKSVSPGSVLHVQVLNNLASLYLETGQYGKGERVVSELTKLTPPAGEMELRTQGSIAALHMARGRNGEAEQIFLGVLAGWEKAGRARDAAVILNNLGVLAMQRNDARTALTRLRRSYDLWRQEIGGDHVIFIYTIANYGAALLANGEAAAAYEHLNRALELAEQWYGQGEQATLQISAIYANALAATGRKKEAKSLRAKIARASSALRPHTVDVSDLMPPTRTVR